MSVGQEKLTRSAILRAGVELVDEQGVEALSMRRLGSRLGVEAMSLYHHVSSKEALLDGVVEVVLNEAAGSTRRGWRARLRDLAHRYRAAAHRHPNVVLLFSSRTLTAPSWGRLVEETFDGLRRGGFGEEPAVNAYRIFWGYVVGYVLAELRAADHPAGSLLERLPKDEFPATLAHARALAGVDRDREFDRGVELVLDAIATLRVAR